MYINSSLAKVEALKAGYDEAILLDAAGLRERVHRREHLRRAGRRASSPRPPRPARSRASPSDSVMTIARDLGYDGRSSNSSSAPTSTLADEAFLTGTAAEVVPIRSVDDRAIGEPRPDHPQAPGDVLRRRARRGRPVQGLVRACPLTTCPQYATRAGPSASRSTTRRCATAASSRASRSPSTTSCASPSSSTGSASTSSRAAGPAPTRRTTSSSGGRTTELHARHVARWSPSARPAGSRARSTPTTRCATCVDAGTSTVCIVGKSWDYHVPEALQHHARRGRGHGRRLGRVPARRRPRRALRRRALLRRLPAQPRVRLRVLEAAAQAGADRLVLCDTNGGTLPARRRARSCATVVDYFGADVGVGVHLHDDAGCGVANALAGVRGGATPGAGHDQRLRRAHRQLQPHHDHPEPHAEDGDRDASRATASSGSRRSRTTSPSW